MCLSRNNYPKFFHGAGMEKARERTSASQIDRREVERIEGVRRIESKRRDDKQWKFI